MLKSELVTHFFSIVYVSYSVLHIAAPCVPLQKKKHIIFVVNYWIKCISSCPSHNCFIRSWCSTDCPITWTTAVGYHSGLSRQVQIIIGAWVLSMVALSFFWECIVSTHPEQKLKMSMNAHVQRRRHSNPPSLQTHICGKRFKPFKIFWQQDVKKMLCMLFVPVYICLQSSVYCTKLCQATKFLIFNPSSHLSWFWAIIYTALHVIIMLFILI